MHAASQQSPIHRPLRPPFSNLRQAPLPTSSLLQSLPLPSPRRISLTALWPMHSFNRQLSILLLFPGGRLPAAPSMLHRRPAFRVYQPIHACAALHVMIPPQSNSLPMGTPARSSMEVPTYVSVATRTFWWSLSTSLQWLSLLPSKGVPRPTMIRLQNGVSYRCCYQMALRTINHATSVLIWLRLSYPPLRSLPLQISCTTGLR